MTKLAALIGALALIALAGPAGAQPIPAAAAGAERRLEAEFAVQADLGTVGVFHYGFAQSGNSYRANAERRVTGMFRMLVRRSQDYVYSTRGVVGADGKLMPRDYQHSGGRRDRVVRARFTPTNVVTTTDPPGMSMGDPQATPAMKRGVVDQLTAIAAMISAGDDPCARDIAVYMDGRSRFDFLISPSGRINVATRFYRGEAIRCRVRFRPLAGFSDPQEPAELTFLFAETEAGLFAPIRIQMPTNDVGVVTLEARSVTVNGAPLR